MIKISSNNGYTLVEIVVIIVIIGIITSITLNSLRSSNEIARTEETREEMDRLAEAITGRPDLKNGGTRTDYGYVGDIGALPPNLDALFQNPGGLATWHGPYIRDDFSEDGGSAEFNKDAWGANYFYNGGITITSTGSGSALTRRFAGTVNELLYNRVILVATDLNKTPPGPIYKDSLIFILKYPNGSGDYIYKNRLPDQNGLSEFDSIPIGLHELQIIYIPENDTLIRRLNVNPGTRLYTEITLFKDLW